VHTNTHLAGGVQIGFTSAACDASKAGTLRYDPSEQTLELCNGTAWMRFVMTRPENLVFITSLRYTGDLGGRAGADVKCNTLAQAANLPGTYRAWLSDASTSPATNFTQSPNPYRLVNGVQVAANWLDLVDGNLSAPINVTENGGTVSEPVWTNTRPNGIPANVTTPTSSCNGWTTSSGSFPGHGGQSPAPSGSWTDSSLFNCAMPARLYCFQQ
jgi:hypothetical protein